MLPYPMHQCGPSWTLTSVCRKQIHTLWTLVSDGNSPHSPCPSSWVTLCHRLAELKGTQLTPSHLLLSTLSSQRFLPKYCTCVLTNSPTAKPTLCHLYHHTYKTHTKHLSPWKTEHLREVKCVYKYRKNCGKCAQNNSSWCQHCAPCHPHHFYM